MHCVARRLAKTVRCSLRPAIEWRLQTSLRPGTFVGKLFIRLWLEAHLKKHFNENKKLDALRSDVDAAERDVVGVLNKSTERSHYSNTS